jgi:hypothetical protein
MIPLELIQKTLDTLALLLPRDMPNVKRWYLKKQKSSCLDPGALNCTYLRFEDHNIEHFKSWREWLIKLEEAFDKHEPNGLLQRWRDDRKQGEWVPFWMAMLILFLTIMTVEFGVIQCVAAIAQWIHN